MEQVPPGAQPSLAACATFSLFDATALGVTLNLAPAEVQILLSDPQIEPVPDTNGMFRLQAHAVAPLLAHLRQTQPTAELRLHTLACQHFLTRLEQPLPAAERELLVTACMHHLRELHTLNLDYMRWPEVAALSARLRACAPELASEVGAALDLIDAYKALRTQEYRLCQILLANVLANPELPPALHAEAHLTRGLSAMNQAQLEAAQAAFSLAHNLAGRVGRHDLQGGALINQSWIYNQLNQFHSALDCAQQALWHFAQSNDHYGTAFALYSIGNNAIYLGQWALGQQHLNQAAAIYAPAGMIARLAIIEWARGFLHQLRGDEQASEAAYLRVLVSAASAETGNRVTAIDTLTELGLLYQMQQRWDAAADAYRRAIELADLLSDTLRKVLLMYRFSLLQRERGAEAPALTTLADAIDLLETMRSSTETEAMKIRLLGTTQQIYETMVLAQLAQGATDVAFAYLERARARAFLDLLARRMNADGAVILEQTREPISLSELQACLAPDALVLEYYTIGVVAPGSSFLPAIAPENIRLRRYLTPDPLIVLFAITTTTCNVFPIRFDPNLLLPTEEDPVPGWHLLTEAKLQWLYMTLLEPVAPLLETTRHLHIIPHGPLHYVPFAALQRSDGRYLLAEDGPRLTYAPSATIFRECLERRPAGAYASVSLGYNGTGATQLDLAEIEARRIASITHGQVLPPGPDVRAELLQQAMHAHHLHIAGHATFDAADPLASALLIGPDCRLDAREVMQQLHLNAALVTLNACTSGLSQIASGDELLGLPRAFLYAGAADIVCTLHEVDDLAAYLLMVMFHQNLAVSRNAAQALHATQLRLRTIARTEVRAMLAPTVDSITLDKLLNQLADEAAPFGAPHFWASFVLIGKP